MIPGEHPWRRRRDVLHGLGVVPLLTLAGCAAFDYREQDAPRAREAPPLPRPAIALVLGSGGPRGYAHLGVLQVLEEAGIQPDLVVGSSVGALVAVLWGSGRDAASLDGLSTRGGPLDLFDLSPWADRGWIHGRRLQDYVNDAVGHRPLEALPRRALVVATRRADKAPHVFASGNTGVAVRASSAVPGVLSPVGIEGVEYEDGDESWPVPVRAARAAGAHFVIAVDLYPVDPPPDAGRAALRRSAARRARIDPELRGADFALNPGLGHDVGPWRRYFIECRRRGEQAARDALPRLQAQLRTRALPGTRLPAPPASSRPPSPG